MSEFVPPPPRLQAIWDEANVPLAGSPYAALIDRFRTFLDHLAGARPDDATIATLDAEVAGWTARLAPLVVDERDQMFARVLKVPGHGQCMSPAFIVDHQDDTMLRGRVTFGRYFLGANHAVHGGAIALLFDEVLGIPANAGVATMARTAYLHVNYRSITPIETELQVSAEIASVDGRKRIVRGEVRDGDRLCADAEGLFVELRADQP